MTSTCIILRKKYISLRDSRFDHAIKIRLLMSQLFKGEQMI